MIDWKCMDCGTLKGDARWRYWKDKKERHVCRKCREKTLDPLDEIFVKTHKVEDE